jgi:hypothetical protein
MPFNVEAPMEATSTPARYPAPDWSREAEVRECWLPQEPTIGWLILQDDLALTWASSVGPNRPASYAVKRVVEERIQLSLQDGLNCREAFQNVARVALFRGPIMMSLKDLADRLQKEWS